MYLYVYYVHPRLLPSISHVSDPQNLIILKTINASQEQLLSSPLQIGWRIFYVFFIRIYEMNWINLAQINIWCTISTS